MTPFQYDEFKCQCLVDTKTQLWSINKEKWKSSSSIAPKFSQKFSMMYEKGCSVAIDRNTILFIGGHHLYKLADTDWYGSEFVPLIVPFNDLVYEYNFVDRNWTELPKVPNVKVRYIKTSALQNAFNSCMILAHIFTFRCLIPVINVQQQFLKIKTGE